MTPAPRFAVPDVSALGPVPVEPAAVDAYLLRLDAVRRAMGVAQDAYAAALAERDELRGRLGAYAAKAAGLRAATSGRRIGPDGAGDLAVLEARAREVLDTAPADLDRARALVAAYQAYLGSAQGPAEHDGRPARPGHGGTS